MFEFEDLPALYENPTHDLVAAQALEIDRLKNELEEAMKGNVERDAKLEQVQTDYHTKLKQAEEERDAARNALNDSQNKLKQAEKELEDRDAEIGRYEEVCGEQGITLDELEEELAECKAKLKRSAEASEDRGATKRPKTAPQTRHEKGKQSASQIVDT